MAVLVTDTGDCESGVTTLNGIQCLSGQILEAIGHDKRRIWGQSKPSYVKKGYKRQINKSKD